LIREFQRYNAQHHRKQIVHLHTKKKSLLQKA